MACRSQVQLVQILKEELGSALFIPPAEPQEAWLSPEALKNKFLIRTNVSGFCATAWGILCLGALLPGGLRSVPVGLLCLGAS